MKILVEYKRPLHGMWKWMLYPVDMKHMWKEKGVIFYGGIDNGFRTIEEAYFKLACVKHCGEIRVLSLEALLASPREDGTTKSLIDIKLDEIKHLKLLDEYVKEKMSEDE